MTRYADMTAAERAHRTAVSNAARRRRYDANPAAYERAKAIERDRAAGVREERREAGLCIQCGEPSETYRCATCNARRRDADARASRRASNARAAARYRAKYRNDPDFRERDLARKRAARAALREQGLCVRCRAPSETYQCHACRPPKATP